MSDKATLVVTGVLLILIFSLLAFHPIGQAIVASVGGSIQYGRL